MCRWCCFQISLPQIQRSVIPFVFRTISLTSAPSGLLPSMPEFRYHSLTPIFPGSALHGVVAPPLLWLLLTPHDKLYSTLQTHLHVSVRSPRVRGHSSILISAPFTIHGSVQLSGFNLICNLTPMHCLMWFLFVRAGLCLRLPSDSTSRWTPLALANTCRCRLCSGL